MLPLIDFTPAQLTIGKKDSYVSFYVKNPFTESLERKRIRINFIKDRQERIKYGRLLCLEITKKLYSGWNPFLSELKSKCPMIIDAVNQFVSNKSKSLRPDSMRVYNSNSKVFIQWITSIGWKDKYVAVFSSDMASKFMRYLEERNFTNKTYNNYLRFMNTLFLYFVKKEWMSENPFSRIEHKRNEEKKRTIIPPEDRKRIVEYFRSSNTPEFEFVMMLCFRCFIRPKEMMMLKIENIDYDNCLLTIPSYVAKNHHERTVGVPVEIMSYFNELRIHDRSLFIFSTGYKPGKTMMNTRDVGRTWSIMRRKLNLPDSYQFYSLKDTGITEMLEAGIPAKYVKDLADHHSLEMTDRYTHKSDALRILDLNRIEF